jgi:hypothetical protein
MFRGSIRLNRPGSTFPGYLLPFHVARWHAGSPAENEKREWRSHSRWTAAGFAAAQND